MLQYSRMSNGVWMIPLTGSWCLNLSFHRMPWTRLMFGLESVLTLNRQGGILLNAGFLNMAFSIELRRSSGETSDV